MSFFKQFFNNSAASSNKTPPLKVNSPKPEGWNVRSLNELTERWPLKSGTLPGDQRCLSNLAVGGGIAAVVIEKTKLAAIDLKGSLLATWCEEKPINAVCVDPKGEWIASAEKEVPLVHVRSVCEPNLNLQIDTTASVSKLALSNAAVYAGLSSGALEVYPLSVDSPKRLIGEKQQYKMASQFLDGEHSVEWIEISPSGDQFAVIIGGVLFVSDKGSKTEFTAQFRDNVRFMAARFSPDGKYLAAVGGAFKAQLKFGSGDENLIFSRTQSLFDLYDIEQDRSINLQGEGYWIQNIFWSTNNDKLICLLAAAPQADGKWTKAISFHNVNSILNGLLQPDSVTGIQNSMDSSSAGIMNKTGKLLMLNNKEDAGISYWDVGEAFVSSVSDYPV